MSSEKANLLISIRGDGNVRLRSLYEKHARSIAPGVLGHDEVKKGLLLALIGGVRCVSACCGLGLLVWVCSWEYVGVCVFVVAKGGLKYCPITSFDR